MFLEIRKLEEKRLRLVEQADSILGTAQRENRDLTSEEDQRFSDLHDEIERLQGLIERARRQRDAESRLAEDTESTQRTLRDNQGSREEQTQRYHDVFMRAMRFGADSLSYEDRTFAASFVRSLTPEEARAMGSGGTGAAGAFAVSTVFWNQIQEALLAFGGVRAVAQVINTSTGGPFEMPMFNDTASLGAIKAENTDLDFSDITLAQFTLGSYTYNSEILLVSVQLLQDSEFDFGSFAAGALGKRVARILNTHYSTGTGTGQPQGVTVGAADSGVTLDISDHWVTAIDPVAIFDDLVDLQMSVDQEYRASGRFMFGDSVLKTLKKLRRGTTDAEPIWIPGNAANGEPPTVLGDPYTLNQQMPTTGSVGNRAIVYGDFSNYVIRDVLPARLVRLDERFMHALQVGFIVYARTDAKVMNAGTDPLKYAAMVA